MAKLQKELQQNKGFETVRQEAYLALQRTTDFVSRPVEKVFSKNNLTPEQYNVLRILRGSEPGGLPTLEIGRRMITRASNVTRIIDRLEAKGFAVRRRSARDRRVVNIRIAKEGLELLDAMQPKMDETVELALSGLSDAKAVRLIKLLEEVRDGIEANWFSR